MQEFLSLFTPCLNYVFGPENRQLPDFGSRSGRCFWVHTQISANSTWGNGPFYKKCVFALSAVSSFHVFATTAQPTSNLVWAQKLWSIRVCTCIQVCVCICIGQELAFVFLLGDISNMISVFPVLSGLASMGIFQSHISIAIWYLCLVSSKTVAAISSPDFERKHICSAGWVLRNSWTTTNCSVCRGYW